MSPVLGGDKLTPISVGINITRNTRSDGPIKYTPIIQSPPIRGSVRVGSGSFFTFLIYFGIIHVSVEPDGSNGIEFKRRCFCGRMFWF